uniref:NADH dehydrogenase subunit 2 n=1 Tax=Erysiphe quercicola TaxID=425177 RepID=UPI00233E9247|nr:NADH dehydrogenase subunit 2 [Erysiphe quercicola]WBR75373.1 NADH dehydrogenase subunit 2 [Erysiphe quercicola]
MLILSIIFLLLSNAVTLRRDKSILYSRVAIIVLLYSSIIAINSLFISSLAKGIGLYGGLFHATAITQNFHIFIFIISAIIIQLTAFYPRRVLLDLYSSLSFIGKLKLQYKKSLLIDKDGEQFKIIEYPLILLFIVSGAVFLISTSDLVSIFLSIELQSYGLYLLSTIYRNSELATNGGITYFLLGGLSSCFILFGISLIYANSGTTNLDGLYIITSLSDLSNGLTNNVSSIDKSDYINYSLLILSVGFLFKISAAPFHFWSPLVYDAIPTIVTTFVAIIAKISILIFLLELVHYTSNSLFNYKYTWTTSLLVSSFISLIIGSILGLREKRIKRLLAYSTISHLGFLLLALTINSIESIYAFIFYLLQYSISNLNVFIILISIGYSFYSYVNNSDNYKQLKDKNNSPIQLISQLKGYFNINPLLSLSLAITIFSFVGIPPLIGFFAKQMVLSAALDSGYVFVVLIAILTSVISAVYYLNIIKEVFFYKTDYKFNSNMHQSSFNSVPSFLASASEGSVGNKIFFKRKKEQNIILSSYLTITISILTLLILLFICFSVNLLDLVNILSLSFL